MGHSQSLFYPDNPKRRDRAQQLASDCQNFVDQYNQGRKDIEMQLGPDYQSQVQKLLEAFGCKSIDDLDGVVQQKASGQALKDWDEVKDKYDRSQIVDQVIMTFVGVMAIAGVSISEIDAVAGGFAFAEEGISIVGDIASLLGGIGVIFDIVEGAALRSKLRDAIDKLFTSRIKGRRVVTRFENLVAWIPQLQNIYQAIESTGYSPDAITDLLKNSGIAHTIQEDLKPESFYKAAQELNALDNERGSWTNEDPNWEAVARELDIADALTSIIGAVTYTRRKVEPEEPEIDNIMPPPPPYEQSVRVLLSADTNAPGPLHNPLHLSVHTFVDPLSAGVLIYTDDGHYLGINTENLVVEAVKDKVHWTVSFAEEADIDRFGPHADFDLSGVELPIVLSNKGAYVGFEGALVPGREQAAVFLAKYLKV